MILVLVTAAIVFAILISGIVKKVQHKRDSIEIIRTLPYFNLKRVNGNEFNSDEVRQGPLLIVFFHPECEHCRYEIDDLITLFNNYGDLTSILISHAPLRVIHEYIEKTGLHDSDRLVILSDEELIARELFSIENVPTTLIYNRDLMLLRRFDGEVKSVAISKCLDDID